MKVQRYQRDDQCGHWRRIARPIVKEIVAQHGGDSLACRKALTDAYPFGERAHWPYKVWCSEVRFALRGNGANVYDTKTKELFDGNESC